MNKTEFHIHVDAKKLTKEFESFLKEQLGLSEKNFDGFSDKTIRAAPERHFTGKYFSNKDYLARIHPLLEYVQLHPYSMTGYIEGECIVNTIYIPQKEHMPNEQPPFKLHLKEIQQGLFRQNEIHLSMDRNNSSIKLREQLIEMGFFSVYMVKPTYVAEIFTCQGSIKEIAELIPKLVSYLNDVGGAVNGRIKEERIAHWWISGKDVKLPPVLASTEIL